MYFSTAVIAAFAATYVSASPLMVRDNVCGTTPAGSNANNQPISQPSGIQTSAACQAQCEADNSCQSFTFGMIDNTIQCKLYSCAASAVPSQSSANLVVYDKACTAVPSVVPTSSNPTGKKADDSQTNDSQTNDSQTNDNQTPTNSNPSSQTSQQGAQDGTQKQSSTNPKAQYAQKQSSPTGTQTCGTQPSASTNNQPISTPSATSEAACKAQCQTNNSCKSFTFGTVNNAVICKLYAVAAAQVPAPSNSAQKNALKAYDVGCSN